MCLVGAIWSNCHSVLQVIMLYRNIITYGHGWWLSERTFLQQGCSHEVRTGGKERWKLVVIFHKHVWLRIIISISKMTLFGSFAFMTYYREAFLKWVISIRIYPYSQFTKWEENKVHKLQSDPIFHTNSKKSIIIVTCFTRFLKLHKNKIYISQSCITYLETYILIN